MPLLLNVTGMFQVSKYSCPDINEKNDSEQAPQEDHMDVNEDEIHKLHPYVPEWHTYTKVPVLNSKPTHDPSAVKPTHVCRKRVCKTTKEQNLKMRKELLSLKEEIQNLKHELEQQEHIIVKLKEGIDREPTYSSEKNNLDKFKNIRGKISIDEICESDELMHLHTGLPSTSLFEWIFSEVKDVAKELVYQNQTKQFQLLTKNKLGRRRLLSLKEELLITLMKLKLNLSEAYFAFLFGVSCSTISRIISTWIPFLSHELQGLIHWPDSEDLSQSYPQCFRSWENVVAILDCFEVPIQRPSHVEANSQVFSAYKNRQTIKFLLACTPGGSVSYISPPAGGNMSDVEMFRELECAKKFKPGDACMVDKGFKLEADLLDRSTRLIIPPFVKKGKQFSDKKNIKNKKIAHARIHVERVIGRVRDYQILNSVVPIIQKDLMGHAAVVCCAVTNLKESVVREHH